MALGMYWIDSAVQSGQSYDYKIVGHWQSSGSADQLDYLTNMTAIPGAPLQSPQGLTATFLQGANMVSNIKPGKVIDAHHNVGLNWRLPLQHGKLSPESPVLYHIERKTLSANDRAAAAVSSGYRRLTAGEPVLAPSARTIPDQPEWPRGWPKKSMQYIDQALRPDKYYAYRVRGVDLFGRISTPSTPTIIRVVRKTLPPPAPIITQAKLIDTDDPNLTKAEKLWAASNRKLPGLWLSWRWPRELQQQAPGATEFRVYSKHGSFNSLHGKVKGVKRATDPRFSQVAVEIEGRLTNSVNDLSGEGLRSGPNLFAIQSSTRIQNSFSLRVENIKIPATDLQAASFYLMPEQGPVVVSISPGHSAYKEYDQSRQWGRKPLFTQAVRGAREEYRAQLEGLPVRLRSSDAIIYIQIGLTIVT